MACLTDEPADVRRAPSLARDGVACLILFVVGNVSASIIWQQYFGDDGPSPRLVQSVYAATPMPAESLQVGDDTRPPPIACNAESRLDRQDATDAQAGTGENRSSLTLPSLPNYRCPSGMRFVDGMYCPYPVHECLDYLSVERDRCQQYVANAPCIGTPLSMQFCIDEFEFPNHAGTKPMVWVTYRQAAEFCASGNKRLCTNSEWELACEGPDRLPYTTGFRRDPTRCNYDRPNIVADHDALANPNLRDAEFARVDQREPSGARPDCVSYYGVYDMNGNVDEWVVNENGFFTRPPYRSGLKGGYWGRVRNRCRPTTADHNEWHSDYQVGFRCCMEAATAYAMKP